MLKVILYDYSDVYMLANITITVLNTAAATAAANSVNKKVIFKYCAPSADCISEIKNTQIDKAKDL